VHLPLTTLQLILLAVCLLPSPAVYCDALEVEIEGLEEALLENVRAHIGSKWVSSTTLSSERRRARFQMAAETRVAGALRPYGYYFPEIKSRLAQSGEKSWTLAITVARGEPLEIHRLEIAVEGDGKSLGAIVDWKTDWPLLPATRLDQVVWDEQKQRVLDLAEENGYLSARFETSVIELDLEANSADLQLLLRTGPRAVMGDVQYFQDTVENEVLESLPRFRKGDFYQAWLVDKLRTDLWRTGYFDEIEVHEERSLDQLPPRVDFTVTLKERKKNTHQGTIGYGTDSEFRMQYRWQRHLLSNRGDSLGVGLGWQQRNEELLLFGEYRLPRRSRSNQYWLLGSALKTEAEEVQPSSQNSDEPQPFVSGRVEDFTVRLGKVKRRDIAWSQEQIIETMYVQYLLEKSDFQDAAFEPVVPSGFGQAFLDEGDFIDSNRAVTLGLEWDWPVLGGKRFNTTGHHERAWLFSANDIWGSQQEFTQLYLSSRWNFLLSDRWKLLLRAEAGYTDAEVYEIEKETADDVLGISVTELPFLYRFKAGGSLSVRGYGFESLSSNGIGSNHILTASAEMEYQFRQDWSLAAFYDIGNAFNHWSDVDLKSGAGVGLRWYTIAGALRVDVAQAQDIDGKPWQFHLTIGTPLL